MKLFSLRLLNLFEYMDVYTIFLINLEICEGNYISGFVTWNTIILAFCKPLIFVFNLRSLYRGCYILESRMLI
jgi:hypothetical protein